MFYTENRILQLRQNEWSKTNSIFRPNEDYLKKQIEKTVINGEKEGITILFDYFFYNNSLYSWMKENFSHLNFVKLYHMNSCLYPWNYTSILSDGSLFACCGDITPVKIDTYNFDSVFNNELLLALRKELSSNYPLVCKKCLGDNK